MFLFNYKTYIKSNTSEWVLPKSQTGINDTSAPSNLIQ